MGRVVEVFAPAKVNLRLEILGRRADGFHDLATWMIALDFGDTLRLEGAPQGAPADAIDLTLSGPFASPDIPTDERNLVLRALDACRTRARVLGQAAGDAPMRVSLAKEIPSQSGLGGASSDAFAALEAFESLFDIDLGADWRRALLAELGSDCVFFEASRNGAVGYCEGRGEVVSSTDVHTPDWVIAVVTPELRCATATVFAGLDLPLSPPSQTPMVQGDMFVARAREARRWMFNHLEAAAAKQFPEITRWRTILASVACDHFALSGSGSSFYGLFDSEHEAQVALEGIRIEALRQHTAVRGTWVARAHRRD
ncbi:MAG: 4-diphosphocytidyl-2-C-methyl-D-erythritol kinase [Chlamydiales bacterium]|jgi:4-diphosphocytidyl-2-C-methyl-D-erythritol kinase